MNGGTYGDFDIAIALVAGELVGALLDDGLLVRGGHHLRGV